ncbi:transporter permease [Celerinatantimonas yamalensis]|uniref:Citrate transporter n=1 Tax=Celerinatantimonas yamalensis TaxID=559956 RepID=A0ABW9G5P3_9GAMM
MLHTRSLFQTSLAGWLILSTAVFYLCHSFFPSAALLSALCAWSAVIMCWPTLSKSSHQQSGLLLGSGLLMLIWGAMHGASLAIFQAVTRNLPLLAMFVAVSFLSLTNPTEQDQSQPMGKQGFWSTLLSCHLLGSIINLSIIFVVGDRLARDGKLDDRQVQVMMRGFCAGAYWSPFFVAAGVAMTYAPGAQWSHTVIPGLLLVVPMILMTYWEVSRHKIEQFKGYPLRADSLVMPVILAIAVLALHHLYQQVHILTLITLIAPLGAVVFMRGQSRVSVLSDYIQGRLSNVASQFALFLAAGVFSSGVAVILHVYPSLVQFDANAFTPLMFLIVSGGMILVSLVGVHPVVSVSLISPLLVPLGANPDQLAFLFLSVWGTGTASSPLSGVGLAMISRYQTTSRSVLRLNFRYMVVMWLAAAMVNWAVF